MLAAQQAGLRYLALEQWRVVNTLQNYPVGKYVFFKPDPARAKGSLPLAGAGERKEDLIAAWLATVQQHHVKINEAESCRSIQREPAAFTLVTESATGVLQRYRAAHLILAIGNHGTPRRLNVPGEDLQVTLPQPRKCSQCAALWVKEASSCAVCHATALPQPAAFQQTDKVKYRLGNPADYAGQRCLVVGAGNSAIEAALALTGFQRAGGQLSFAYDTEVTLVIRHDFKRDLKFANKANLYDCEDSGRLRIIFGAEVKALTEQAVLLRATSTKDDLMTLPNDVVLALIGNESPLHFLASLGIQFNPGASNSSTSTLPTFY